MKKMLFVYNPNAGKGLLKAKLSEKLKTKSTAYITKRTVQSAVKLKSY